MCFKSNVAAFPIKQSILTGTSAQRCHERAETSCFPAGMAAPSRGSGAPHRPPAAGPAGCARVQAERLFIRSTEGAGETLRSPDGPGETLKRTDGPKETPRRSQFTHPLKQELHVCRWWLSGRRSDALGDPDPPLLPGRPRRAPGSAQQPFQPAPSRVLPANLRGREDRRTPSRPGRVTRSAPPAGGSGAAIPTCARAERRGGAEGRGRVLPQPGEAAGSAPAPAPEKLSVGAVRSAGARSRGRAAASAGAAAGAGPALWAAGGAGLCPPRSCPPRVHLRTAARPSAAPPRCPPGRRRAAAKRADCGGPSAGCGAGGGRGGRGARRPRAPICAERVRGGGAGSGGRGHGAGTGGRGDSWARRAVCAGGGGG